MDDSSIYSDSHLVGVSGSLCRFCGASQVSYQDCGPVCPNEECQRFARNSCTKRLGCGHYCGGIQGESPCLPCLHGCSDEAVLKQDGDDMCMVCFSESLFAAPCIQLACAHVFHSHCIRLVLEKRWNGGRISFTFSRCPICKTTIQHKSLVGLLQSIEFLYEDVKRKALMRLEYEGLNRCEAIVTPESRFYNDLEGFAMEK